MAQEYKAAHFLTIQLRFQIGAFIPFGDIKDVKTPLDQATQKHCSFGFVTFLEREDAATAMDNMDGEELYDRVLTFNYALPEKIEGGEQGWAAQLFGQMLIHINLMPTLI
ncbi:peptidyl-prolyl cis-trans isomerase E [Olea europaea subsp. europaea]|uniref:Peptidyl-prolyl cis-trans isomerase E n=1 Tax=Olea europaea subsp. europaea TaxID=158383 RepID=A0A8S0UCD6_OLEEU|nr:peptidyl-prolyl cis-trans isomerase E [Olea europaea subsp. europaea]